MQQRQTRKTITEAMRRQAINENYNQLSQPDKLFVNCAANTIYNRLMSKAIIQNTQLTASRVFWGKTDPSDKSNNCWQCSTDNSDERLSFEEISILEESTSNINSEFQYNFKKSKPGENSQLRVSIASNIEIQENIKLPKTKNSFFSYHKDIAQLELIEKKTEQLAMKERKQRKQLKKLKQMLVEHQEQMKSKQFSFQIEKTELMNTIDQLRQNQASLISEKDTIDEKLKNLLVQLKQTKDETTKFKIQKEKLLRHLQFLQANLDNTLSVNNQNQTMRKDSKNRIQQMVEDITELDEIEKEIEIVDSLITRLKKNAHNEQDCEKLLGFYELRSKYVEKRQCLRINKSNKRYQTIIFKLNRIIFNRNQEIDSFIQNHGQRQQENYDKSLVQTSDSFFSKCQIQKNKLYCNKRQSMEKLDQLALKITNITEANTIKEYEEIYENIDNIALSTLYLRNTDDNQSKYLDCLQKSVLEISSCIASKAQRNYQKIRLLMAVIDSQSNAKIKTKYKEAKVQN